VKGLQHYLSQQIQRRTSADLLEHLHHTDRAHRAVMLSCTSAGASLIFTTIPTELDYQLSDAEMDVAVRLRLNCVPRNDMIDDSGNLMQVQCGICPSNKRTLLTTVNAVCAHPHACEMLKRSASTQRHNNVLHTFTRACREVGYHTVLEPMHIDNSGVRSRPDATCWSTRGNMKPMMVDVSVVHPGCTSHVGTGQKLLGCAMAREKVKRSQYASIAADESATFVPLIVESTGALGTQFVKILRNLSAQAADERVSSEREFSHYVRASIAFALFRGNARLVSQFIARSAVQRQPAAAARALEVVAGEVAIDA
jgi:hypothetical protein